MKKIKELIALFLGKFGYIKLGKDEYILNKNDFRFFSAYWLREQREKMLRGERCELSEEIIDLMHRVNEIRNIDYFNSNGNFVEWESDLLRERKEAALLAMGVKTNG